MDAREIALSSPPHSALNSAEVASQEFFKAAFTFSPIPVLFIGVSGVLDCNDAAMVLLGATQKHQIVGLHPAVFSPEVQPDGISSAEKSKAMDALAREKGTHTFEWMHRKLDGTDFPVEVTLTPVTLGSEIVLLTQWRDLTAEKKAVADLNQLVTLLKTREEYFRNIYDNSPLGIIEMDADFHFISASQSFANFIGYSERELKSMTLLELTHPEDRAVSLQFADPKLAAQAQTIQFQKRYIHRSGRIVWAQISAKFIKTSVGKPRFISMIADVTSEKEKEIELLQAREQLSLQEVKAVLNAKLAALGQMAGSIAHEINNPLAIVLGKTQQAHRRISAGQFSNEAALEYVETVTLMGDRMMKIVKGLTLQARSGENDPHQETLVSEVLEDVISLSEEKFKTNGIEFKITRANPEIKLVCSRVQLGQVLINLLNNAFDAASITSGAGAWVELACEADTDVVRFNILNSGPKMAEEIRSKIMQPFFTTKGAGKGTGLGLSISQTIVDNHAGHLEVDLTGKNTKFIISIPVAVPQR